MSTVFGGKSRDASQLPAKGARKFLGLGEKVRKLHSSVPSYLLRELGPRS